MYPTFLLRCALIGATTALIIRIVLLFIQKQPHNTWPPLDKARGPLADSWLITFLNENKFVLLKTVISGALLGMAGGYAGYTVSTWVAEFSQHWLVLLLSAIIAAFAVGWVLQMLLERLVWRRLGGR